MKNRYFLMYSFIATLFLLVPNIVYGQYPGWTVYNTSNSGLPNIFINSITVDQDGNKWIGTHGGLAKLSGSGSNWTVFNTNNSGLPYNVVNSIKFDLDGSAWIATDNGLAKLSGNNWIVYDTSNSGLPFNQVLSIDIETNGTKWIGTTAGLVKYDNANWVLYNTSNSALYNNVISAIEIDVDGNKWLGTENGLVKFDNTNWSVYGGSIRIYALAIDNNGNKWIGTQSGLSKFDNFNWTYYNTNNSGLPAAHVLSIAVDSEGNKWIGTNDGGLAKFTDTNWTVFHTANSGIQSNTISAIAIDLNGNKWIGSYDINGGLSRFHDIISCPGIPTVTYAGKTYNTVLVGNQCWLKENLDVGTMLQGYQNPTDNGIIEKYCYSNIFANCNTYGGFYRWNETMQYTTTASAQGICPSGWRIPSYSELETLKTAVNNDANTLKEIGQGIGSGIGTNISGFSALLSGYCYPSGVFGNLNSQAYFWSSTETGTSSAYSLDLYNDNNNINFTSSIKSNGFNVRCIKDQTTSEVILNSPNGNENWQALSQHNITWTSNNILNVEIEYTTNNGTSWIDIVSSTPGSTGSYAWTVPNSQSTQCKVRISDASNSAINDASDNVFTISNITVTSPNGSENWQASTQKAITWTSQNIGNINIEYSINNGVNWSTISSDIPSNTGQFLWTVLNTPSNQCKVRIVSSQYPDIKDMSDGLFTINHLKVTAPNGGEVWQGGSQKSILWESSLVTNVKIEYTTNNGTDWTSIISSTPASAGQYFWNVPNAASTQCKIRIGDIVNTDITDLSDGIFTISAIPLLAKITADSIWLDSDFDGLVLKQVSGNLSIGSITLYEWFVNGVPVAQGVSPTIELRTGENILKLKVTDSFSQVNYDSVKIKVYSSKSRTNGGIYSGVTQIGNQFYVTSLDKGVYRFDSTGVLTPPYMTGGSIQSTLAISNKNLLYTGSDDTRLYCFDISLNSIWDKSTGGIIKASPSITTDGNTIYIGTNNGYLKSLDANNGNSKWTFIANGGIISSPTVVELVDSNQTVVETIIYFGTDNGVFYALKDKGLSYEQFWSMTTTPDSGITSSPAISPDGMIYFGSKNGYLYRVKWDGEYQTTWKKYTGGKIVSSPLIGKNDLVFVASESGFLYGYEKEFTFEASPKKQFRHQWGVNGTPSIGKDGNLYIGCNNGTFYKLEDISGNLDLGIKWYLTANSGIESPILATETGLVVVGCTNGDIYIMKDLSANIEGTENLNLAWPTFKGNNKRNKVTRIVTSATGLDNITELPSKYNLSQNYPNPFNPSTVINYQIPMNTFVSLKVYDMIGNEVLTLVDELKVPGYYSVNFNASSLSTGVYFYQLNAGEYVSTKKLVLIK